MSPKQSTNTTMGNNPMIQAMEELCGSKLPQNPQPGHNSDNNISRVPQFEHGGPKTDQTMEEAVAVPEAQPNRSNNQPGMDLPRFSASPTAEVHQRPRKPLPGLGTPATTLPTPSLSPHDPNIKTPPTSQLEDHDDEAVETMQDPMVVPQAQPQGSFTKTGGKLLTHPLVAPVLAQAHPGRQIIGHVPEVTPAQAAKERTYSHVITGPNNVPQQAPRDCWAHLQRQGQGVFPEEVHGTKERSPAAVTAWLPYIVALGLKQGTYPKMSVADKRAQNPKAGNPDKRLQPSWAFLIYVLIAVSPEGKLTLREIYNLALAWCPGLNANNATCRHQLSTSEEFWKVDTNKWRLAESEGANTVETSTAGASQEATSGPATTRSHSSPSKHQAAPRKGLPLSSTPKESAKEGRPGQAANNEPPSLPLAPTRVGSRKRTKNPKYADSDDSGDLYSSSPRKRLRFSDTNPQSSKEKASPEDQHGGSSFQSRRIDPDGLAGDVPKHPARPRTRPPPEFESVEQGQIVGPGPATAASLREARARFNTASEEQESEEPSEQNGYHSRVHFRNSRSPIRNWTEMFLSRHQKKMEEGHNNWKANNPNGDKYPIRREPAFPNGWEEPGLNGSPQGRPFMTALPKGRLLEQTQDNWAKDGKKIQLATYEKQVLQLAQVNEDEDFTVELKEGFSTVEKKWAPDCDRRMRERIDEWHARRYPVTGTKLLRGKEGSAMAYRLDEMSESFKLKPIEEFSESNVRGEIFPTSNVRGEHYPESSMRMSLNA